MKPPLVQRRPNRDDFGGERRLKFSRSWKRKKKGRKEGEFRGGEKPLAHFRGDEEEGIEE